MNMSDDVSATSATVRTGDRAKGLAACEDGGVAAAATATALPSICGSSRASRIGKLRGVVAATGAEGRSRGRRWRRSRERGGVASIGDGCGGVGRDDGRGGVRRGGGAIKREDGVSRGRHGGSRVVVRVPVHAVVGVRVGVHAEVKRGNHEHGHGGRARGFTGAPARGPGEAPLRGDLPSAPASARAPRHRRGGRRGRDRGVVRGGGHLERGERVEVRGGAERRGVRRHGGREEEARAGRRVDRSRETCHRELFKRGDETPRRGVKTGANRARIARAWTPTARACATCDARARVRPARTTRRTNRR